MALHMRQQEEPARIEFPRVGNDLDINGTMAAFYGEKLLQLEKAIMGQNPYALSPLLPFLSASFYVTLVADIERKRSLSLYQVVDHLVIVGLEAEATEKEVPTRINDVWLLLSLSGRIRVVEQEQKVDDITKYHVAFRLQFQEGRPVFVERIERRTKKEASSR